MKRASSLLVSLAFSIFFLLPGAPLATSVSSLGTVDRSDQAITYLPMGDSYTIGRGVSRNQNWPHQLVNRLQLNGGQRLTLVAEPAVGGYTTQDLINHELSDVGKYQPDLITIEIGTNDMLHHVAMPVFQQHLNHIIQTIQSQDPHAHVLLITIPDMSRTPMAPHFGKPAALQTKVKVVNDIIAQAGLRYHLPVADLYGVSQAVAHDPSLISRDNFHPSDKGYTTWVDAISQKLIDTQLLHYPADTKPLNNAQY
jgi:lysophospholipase L1-like esterase